MSTLQHSSDIVGMATEIPAWACRELMKSTLVGRVAFVDEDGPVVLPVNFVLDGDTVLFCTSSANAIGRHLDSATVEFEVHEFDGPTKSGWSVVVRGVASFVSARELSRDEGLPPFSWADGVRTFVVRVTPVSVTGRRISCPAEAGRTRLSRQRDR